MKRYLALALALTFYASMLPPPGMSADVKTKFGNVYKSDGVTPIPRYFSTDAFTDNLTLYGNDLIAKGPWVDVRAGYGTSLKAVCDGSTDDTLALQSIIDNVPNGKTLLFPGVCKTTGELNFSGKQYITLRGLGWSSDGSPVTSSGIRYEGGSSRSVVWFVGANYMKIEDMEISSSATTPPKVILALGRSDTGSYGWHEFRHIRIHGYATVAAVYSIASEVNTWDSIKLQLAGGGGKYVFYTSQADDLSVSTGNFTESTNLSLFMNNFWIWNLVDDNNAASIYISGRASTGDMYFRNGSGASTNGSHIQINVVNNTPTYGDSAFGLFVFDSIRMEPYGAALTKYGIYLSSDAGTTDPAIFRITASNLNFYQSDALLRVDDRITLANFIGTNLKITYPCVYVFDVYNIRESSVTSTSGGASRIRNASHSNFFVQAGAVSLPSGPSNTFLHTGYSGNAFNFYGPVKTNLAYQGIDNNYFHQYYGTTIADDNAVNNITLTNGTDNVVGPKNGSHGWSFTGMIRQNVNDTDRWMPFYTYTP